MVRKTPSPHQELNRSLRDLARRYAEHARNSLGEDLTSVVLFGSVARGEAGPQSDIDLLVVARELPAGAFRRRDVLRPVRDLLLPDLEALWDKDIYVDFSEAIKTEGEAARTHLLYLDMIEEAVLLYDRKGFFADVLAGLRRRLHALGARKVREGPMPYWDLKPDLQPGEVFEL